MKKLFVGNLPWSVGDDDLREHFEAFGEVFSAVVIKDRESGRSRGFGFVEMEDDAARRSIEEMDGQELQGRAIRVNEAQERRR